MLRSATGWLLLVFVSVAFAAWYLHGNQPEPIAKPGTQAVPLPAAAGKTKSAVAFRAKPPDVEAHIEPTEDWGDFERLATLLENQRYEEAVDLYGTVYSQVSEDESKKYRARILAFANSLSDRGKTNLAQQLLQHYVNLFYKDIAALKLLAYNLHALQRYPAEIEALLAALDEAHEEGDIASLRTRLDNAVKTHAAALRETNDPAVVAAFYQGLADRQSDHPPLRIGLAGALISSGQTEQAVSILNGLAGESAYSGEVSRLLTAAGQSAPMNAAAIPVRRVGNSYVVQATINGHATVTLLIDTGATLTVMRPDALRLAGVYLAQSNRMAVFNTANGSVEGPIFRLESIRLGDYIVEDIEVGSISLKGLGQIDGLLGMNFLNQFEFALNQQDQVLLLTR